MYDGWGDPDFDGSMQEFRVWSRPLTYDEIVACDEAGPDEMPDWTPKPPVPVPLSGLYRHWKFDTVYDEIADVPVQLFGDTHLNSGALVINGNGYTHVNYAQLSGNNFPAEYDGGITIELWQTTTARRNWTRVFDFGTDSNNYTFITTAAGSANTARAAVKCGSTEEYVDSTYMTPGQRWHAAVVYDLTSQAGKTLLSVCTFDPSGNMTMSTATMNQDMANAMSSWNINYLGRSFYPDNDFTGSIQDFKIWKKMLTEEELRALDSAGPNARLQ